MVGCRDPPPGSGVGKGTANPHPTIVGGRRPPNMVAEVYFSGPNCFGVSAKNSAEVGCFDLHKIYFCAENPTGAQFSDSWMFNGSAVPHHVGSTPNMVAEVNFSDLQCFGNIANKFSEEISDRDDSHACSHIDSQDSATDSEPDLDPQKIPVEAFGMFMDFYLQKNPYCTHESVVMAFEYFLEHGSDPENFSFVREKSSSTVGGEIACNENILEDVSKSDSLNGPHCSNERSHVGLCIESFANVTHDDAVDLSDDSTILPEILRSENLEDLMVDTQDHILQPEISKPKENMTDEFFPGDISTILSNLPLESAIDFFAQKNLAKFEQQERVGKRRFTEGRYLESGHHNIFPNHGNFQGQEISVAPELKNFATPPRQRSRFLRSPAKLLLSSLQQVPPSVQCTPEPASDPQPDPEAHHVTQVLCCEHQTKIYVPLVNFAEFPVVSPSNRRFSRSESILESTEKNKGKLRQGIFFPPEAHIFSVSPMIFLDPISREEKYILSHIPQDVLIQICDDASPNKVVQKWNATKLQTIFGDFSNFCLWIFFQAVFRFIPQMQARRTPSMGPAHMFRVLHNLCKYFYPKSRNPRIPIPQHTPEHAVVLPVYQSKPVWDRGKHK